MRILMIETGGATASVYAADWLCGAARCFQRYGHEVRFAAPFGSLPADRLADCGVDLRLGGAEPSAWPGRGGVFGGGRFVLTFLGDEGALSWSTRWPHRFRTGARIGVGFLPEGASNRHPKEYQTFLDGLVLLSREARAAAEDLPGLEGVRIANIPVGVELETLEERVRALGGRHACRQRLGFGPDLFVVGCVLAPGSDPGYQRLLEAFDRLAADRPQSRLLLVAPAVASARLTGMADGLPHAASRITWLEDGHLPELFVPAMDVLVEPRTCETVQFSRPALLAMACYVPPVTSNAGGLREQVRDGRDGIVVPLSDAGPLYAVLRRLAGDGELRRTLARNARAAVESGFRSNLMWERVESYVDEVLS